MGSPLHRIAKLTIIAAFAVLTACASTHGKSTSEAEPSTGAGQAPVTIEFKGVAGQSSETRYYSNSRTLTYEASQLTRDRQEGVDFTVVTRVNSYDPKEKILIYQSKTVRKDGAVALHDLAFPELKEEIDYIQRATGEILKAGEFPKDGLFYVPSLPMPREPVKVGDTWAMSHVWYSAGEGIPLKLEVIGILKDIVPCEKSKCADIELSGGVALVAVPDMPGAKFSSRIWGRLLFSLDRGDIIWSEVRSQEDMGVLKDRTVVSSCMVSETKLAAAYKTKFSCDAKEQDIQAVPKL